MQGQKEALRLGQGRSRHKRIEKKPDFNLGSWVGFAARAEKEKKRVPAQGSWHLLEKSLNMQGDAAT
jgi:hypothetical protein